MCGVIHMYYIRSSFVKTIIEVNGFQSVNALLH